MNFDVISKNVIILQIGPVEPKLWKICESNGEFGNFKRKWTFWNHTTTISRIFHNFGSTGPICKIFTFLEMASEFVGSSSSTGERGMKIEAVTSNQSSISLISGWRFYFIIHMFFITLQECLYLGHRGSVVEFPAQGPSTSRRFPVQALAEDCGNLLLVRGPRPGNSTTAPLWPG